MLRKWASSLVLQVTTLLLSQFPAVEAGSADNLKSIDQKKLDLVGLISALGTESARKSFAFSSMNDAFSITGHVGPGSLSLATSFLQMTGLRFAQLLALGNSPAPHVECPQGFQYLGLHSNTKCPVLNTVGASLISEHKRLWKRATPPKIQGRNASRSVEVLVLSLTGTTSGARAQLKGKCIDGLLLGWLPLVLTAGIVCMACVAMEWFIGGLIALGALGMALAVWTTQSMLVFKYDDPSIAAGAPERGDCLVYSLNSDTFHIVEGTEASVQGLFQRSLKQEDKLPGKLALLLSGVMLYAYSIASILWLPNVSVYGQVFFTCANFVGLVADMVKGSKNGNLGFARKAKEQFDVKLKTRVVFGNRTAAMAFIARHTENCSFIKSAGLLPVNGPSWEKWWELLPKACHGGLEHVMKSLESTTTRDDKLFETLVQDMKDGLSFQAG
ncbi:hypothetical protein SELMODRAFT_421490 [Selaginella moellendorffii]|uniref:Uncharacterized protein n=1 Tax=Selaginella moellendorffii TaxID=88036 RepID=D8SFF9_SELML|nr:hypothetical protein SELMODRAFT_421490 [Selaginella moellendorffii]